MPKFRVNWHLALDGEFFEPGAEVDLTEAKAETLAGGVLTPLTTPEHSPPEAPSDEHPPEVPVGEEPADGPTADDPPVTARAGRKGKGGG